jgi:hypothetical protein
VSDLVSFKEVANRLGVDQTTVRRLIQRSGNKLGITVRKGRSPGRNAMWANFLSREDTEHLIAYYESRNMARDEMATEETFQAFGFFCIIQLVPEAFPNRVKMGYTDYLNQRLADHQTAAPTARLLASWPCKRSWDYAAMDSITRSGCKFVLNEVYEGEVQGFIDRGGVFFAVMPKPDIKKELSEHSLLNDGGSPGK